MNRRKIPGSTPLPQVFLYLYYIFLYQYNNIVFLYLYYIFLYLNNNGPVLFAIQRNPILSYSSKFSKNHFFLYSNQNPIISYSVDPTTFYILHTYFIPLFTSYTPISYHLLHLTHLFPTTFYILHTYTLPPFTSYTPIPYHLLPKFLESCLNPILIINHQNPVQITSQTDPKNKNKKRNVWTLTRP